MKLKTIISSLVLLVSAQSYAMFCPSNFNAINIGDSIDLVAKQCGKPTTEKKSKSTANIPQEWTYYMQMIDPADSSYIAPGGAGTMKVTFAFIDNKVVNITSNGIGVGSTTICKNINLQIASSLDDVKKACGKPVSIVQTDLSQKDAQGTPAEEIIEWSYNSNPPATLVFEHGKLTARK